MLKISKIRQFTVPRSFCKTHRWCPGDHLTISSDQGLVFVGKHKGVQFGAKLSSNYQLIIPQLIADATQLSATDTIDIAFCEEQLVIIPMKGACAFGITGSAREKSSTTIEMLLSYLSGELRAKKIKIQVLDGELREAIEYLCSHGLLNREAVPELVVKILQDENIFLPNPELAIQVIIKK